MVRQLHSIACHAYGAAAVLYLLYLLKPWRWIPFLGRSLMGTGLVLHAIGLAVLFTQQGGRPVGMAQAFSSIALLLVAIYLVLDLRYRVPVLGAFLTPLALLVLVPGLILGTEGVAEGLRGPLLPVHVTVALLGVAAFAVAAGVGGVYLLMERQVKGKRFGLLFSRLPSLQLLDDLNRRLVSWGFIALSVTVVTGALFTGSAFWSGPKQIATVVAWLAFAALLNARAFAGWQGRRAAMLTMAGFAVLVVSFWTAFTPALSGGPH